MSITLHFTPLRIHAVELHQTAEGERGAGNKAMAQQTRHLACGVAGDHDGRQLLPHRRPHLYTRRGFWLMR